MVKNDLLKKIADKTELSQKDIDSVLISYVDVVNETLSENREEKITLGNLGSFKAKTVPERKGKIMLGDKKGEEYCVPEHDEITFKMSKSAKLLA